MNKEINKIKEKDKIEVMVFKKYRKHDLYKFIAKIIFLMNLIWNITENLFDRKISSISRYWEDYKIIITYSHTYF